MNIYFALGLCFLPFILSFAGFKIFSKTGFGLLLIASLLGLVAVLPITFLQFYFSFLIPTGVLETQKDVARLFIKVLIFNGLIEELLKTLLIAFIPAKKLKLNQFLICSILMGICLASFESAVYFLQNMQGANARGVELLYNLIFIRIFTADLIHSACAGLCGLFIWSVRAKSADGLGIVFAVLIHTVFNFFGYVAGSIHWINIFTILFAIIECRVRYIHQIPEEAASSENETIIVFQQNEEPGDKRKKMDPKAVEISQTKPADFDKTVESSMLSENESKKKR